MKTITYQGLTLALLLSLGACEQDRIDLKAPETQTYEPCPDGATAGSADFTKFVAIGNSFVAGVQGGALFTSGQDNSLAAIMNRQFECVGASSTFKQPAIGASLGWNLFVTQPILTDPTKPVLGRMLLQYKTTPDCGTTTISPSPTPQAYNPGQLEALPNPSANPGFLYGGSKAELNNFAVPAIVLGQALITQTGDWSLAPNAPFNPFYGRLAFPGGSSTIIGDAAAAGGTFFLFWLGLDDFFLHAAYGGDATLAPLTTGTAFTAQLNAAIQALLMSNAELKGVIGNFPNIFAMPHFTSIAYNPVPLDATSATAVNTAFGGYNAVLDALIANAAAFGISDALKTEIGMRKISVAASCNNAILIADETLADLGPYFDALVSQGLMTGPERTALESYRKVRQTKQGDIIPLSAGAVLGTLVGGNPQLINGVTVPLADRYVILPSEAQEIEAARLSFNTAIASVASSNATRLALADVNAAMNTLITNRAGVADGVTITPNINPPTGIYSEDGAHPNTRGYAFLAGVFIDAINATFDASVPKPRLSDYPATGLPIPAP